MKLKNLKTAPTHDLMVYHMIRATSSLESRWTTLENEILGRLGFERDSEIADVIDLAAFRIILFDNISNGDQIVLSYRSHQYVIPCENIVTYSTDSPWGERGGFLALDRPITDFLAM